MRYCSLSASRLYVSDEGEILASLTLEEEEHEPLLSGNPSDRIINFLQPFLPLVFENKPLADFFGAEYRFPNPAGELARGLSEDTYEMAVDHSRRAVTSASEKKDRHIIQAISAISEIDETMNLLSERLREWFSLHYPELSRETRDNTRYAELVFQFGRRNNFPDASPSMGAEIDGEDESSMRLLAQTIVELCERRARLTEYVNDQTQKIAPNMTHLVGGVITAKLLSCAGGLEELARKPSSTVQLLGAEKALFRHLKTGADPPKHGILFQYPPITNAPWWQRGKIARMVASKVAILAKVDFYGHNFVADKVEEDVKRRIEEIRKMYPEAPAKEKRIVRKKMRQVLGKKRRRG